MGIYHITYTPELSQVCLYFGARCNFSCHGCITKHRPEDCHLNDTPRETKNKTLSKEEVMSYIAPLSFKRAVFLGREPTVDPDFLALAKELKAQFFTYSILITNGYQYVENKVIDEICVSIKAISKKIFKDFTGKDNPERVLKNFKKYADTLVLKMRAESIFIPSYIDKDEIEKITRFIASVDPLIPYRIDGYIPSSVYSPNKIDNFRRPTENEMKEVKIIAERYLKNVSILHAGVKIKHRVERVY